jgi:hypothetical protein
MHHPRLVYSETLRYILDYSQLLCHVPSQLPRLDVVSHPSAYTGKLNHPKAEYSMERNKSDRDALFVMGPVVWKEAGT